MLCRVCVLRPVYGTVAWLLLWLLYWGTASQSLDDFDSINFALALEDFNIPAHQPHPFGYPIEVATGRLALMVTGNALNALLLVSSLAGSAGILLIYRLASSWFSPRLALLVASMTAVTPLWWLNSIKAMSDMLGMALLLLAVIPLQRYWLGRAERALWTAALLAGLAVGGRVHNAFLLAPMLAAALLRHRAGIRSWLAVAVFGLVGVGIWLVPMLVLTGPEAYWQSLGDQLAWRMDKPEASALAGSPDLWYFLQRFVQFAGAFIHLGLGIEYRYPELSSLLLAVLLLIGLSVGIWHLHRLREPAKLWLPGLLTYLVMLYLALPPSNPRYLLILVPVIAAVVSVGLWSLGHHGKPLAAALLVTLVVHSLNLAMVLHNQATPPVQVIDYLNRQAVNESLVVARTIAISRHLELYRPKFKLLSTDFSCDQIGLAAQTSQAVYEPVYSILDRAVGTKSCRQCPGLSCTDAGLFERDRRVHWKHHQIQLLRYAAGH